MTPPKSLTVIVILSLIGISISSGQLLQFFYYHRLQKIVQVLTAEQSGISTWHQQDDLKLAKDLFAASAKAEKFALFNPRAAFAHARSALLLASKSESLDNKAALICAARSSFIHAAKLAPAVVEHQIAWADLDAQLHHPVAFCNAIAKTDERTAETARELSPDERLDFALKGAPFDGRNQYLAALVFLAQGNKTRALELMRYNQEFNPYFSDAQRDFVSQLVWTEDDLRHAIPRKFPEVIKWIERYRQNRPDDYKRWMGAFVDAVSASIDELVGRLESSSDNLASVGSYLSDIAQLPLCNSNDHLRKRLDQILSRVYVVGHSESRTSSWSSILAERAKLHRVPIAKSLIADDRNPRGTALFAWTVDDDTRTGALDVVGRSLGLMFPNQIQPTMIIIESSSSAARIAPEEIEIWQSADNVHYSPVEDRTIIKSTSFLGRQRLIVDARGLQSRFLKFRYMGTSQQSRFSNTMQQLLQVYSADPSDTQLDGGNSL